MDTKRIAAALVRHARKAMPPQQAAWGQAMEREVQEIAASREALVWAFGCVATSYGERLKAEQYLLPMLGRLYLACVCIAYAAGNFIGAPYEQLLCKLTGNPNPIYLPFPFSIPFASALLPHLSAAASCYFMPPAPFWPSALVLAKSALFLFAAVQLIRNRASALHSFALAVAISIALSAPFFLWLLFGPADRPWLSASMQLHWQLLMLLFQIVYPLIICTCIALLVRKEDRKTDIAR
jgi:hypothetical protein